MNLAVENARLVWPLLLTTPLRKLVGPAASVPCAVWSSTPRFFVVRRFPSPTSQLSISFKRWPPLLTCLCNFATLWSPSSNPLQPLCSRPVPGYPSYGSWSHLQTFKSSYYSPSLHRPLCTILLKRKLRLEDLLLDDFDLDTYHLVFLHFLGGLLI